jgi:hypothetical protein
MPFSFPDSVFMGFLVNGMRMLHAMAHVTGLFMDPNSDHGVTTLLPYPFPGFAGIFDRSCVCMGGDTPTLPGIILFSLLVST